MTETRCRRDVGAPRVAWAARPWITHGAARRPTCEGHGRACLARARRRRSWVSVWGTKAVTVFFLRGAIAVSSQRYSLPWELFGDVGGGEEEVWRVRHLAVEWERRTRGQFWLDAGSNRGHEDFQSSALPTELSSLVGFRHDRIFVGSVNVGKIVIG